MAFSDKDDIELKMKARKELASAKDPLTKLRLQCMCNGASGIKGLSRRFRLMNEDDDKFLSKTEFKNGIKGFGLMVTDAEIDQLFNIMDKDGSNTISMAEFFRAIRPEIPNSRLKLIKQAFTVMDKTGDGVITIHDLQNVYNAKKHPKYLSGDWSETRVFQEFLKNFEAPNDADGQVTWEEFFDYYSSISDSIDGDSYFDLMMRNSYKM